MPDAAVLSRDGRIAGDLKDADEPQRKAVREQWNHKDRAAKEQWNHNEKAAIST